MENGFSTGNSLGLGLPGAKRLMNSFEIESQAGQGTHIVMRKYPRGY
jgi:serine/threonine-protein kinase RsbT